MQWLPFLNSASRSAPLDCLKRLHAAVEDLARLTTGTEGDFLTIGEKLRDFSARTKELSKLSSSITERMAGAEVTDAMEGLQEIFGRIGSLDGESGRGRDALTSILGNFGGIRNHLLGFDKTVRNLHALCSFIKIESARSGRGDTGFDTLSDDVKTLARNIESQSARLLDQVALLTALIGQNLEKIKYFEDRQHQQARRILDDAVRNLATLREKHGHSTAAMKAFSAKWEHVSRNIGEVVSSMQFHDITRQRIEHVGDALSELAEGLRPSGTSGGGGRGAARSLWRTRGKGRGAIGAIEPGQLRLAVDTCELQAAQLCHARDELVTAVNAIIDNIRDIARSIETMSEETFELVGVSDRGGPSFLSGLDEDLASLISAISDYVNVNQDLSAALLRATEMVAQMSGFVNEIEKIGIEMKMIAVNASIHAAHIGEEGLALGVLADALHPLSLETSRQIGAIAEALKSVIGTSRELSEKLDGNKASDTGDTGRVAGHLEAMMNPLRRLDEDNLSVLTRIGGEVKALSDDIGATVAAINIHNRMDNAVTAVNAQLQGIMTEMRAVLPAGKSRGEGEHLQELSARYTMDKEREIHLSVAKGTLPLSAPSTDNRLHHATAAPAGAGTIGPPTGKAERIQAGRGETEKTQQGDLGDNVELF